MYCIYYCLFEYIFEGKYWGLRPVYTTTDVRYIQSIVGKSYCECLQEAELNGTEDAHLMDPIYVNERIYVGMKIGVEDTCKIVYLFSRNIRLMKDATYNLYFDWKGVFDQIGSWIRRAASDEDVVKINDQYREIKKHLISEERILYNMDLLLTNKKINGRFLKVEFHPRVCS
jgi:hypothetical protein